MRSAGYATNTTKNILLLTSTRVTYLLLRRECNVCRQEFPVVEVVVVVVVDSKYVGSEEEE